MLKILRYVLSPVVLIIAVYGLITKNFDFQSIMILLLGLLMLVMGLEEFRKEKKTLGWLLIAVFIFSLFVSIQGLLMN
ncbi:DUF3953 domain-containing protein [Metabacillus endolithicus]|uniref:DUF3953 domain-containing protein n=1 Tax=Metabacillus endolithicus TaxID=1535204 RepID=A0ABW5BPM2_9BACI|nr:DUF3953 domain-containing protein [Metabacillus endolithicus]UPG63868.1 DUF3953 domain-containing protein [Metabacillus endolithicus]